MIGSRKVPQQVLESQELLQKDSDGTSMSAHPKWIPWEPTMDRCLNPFLRSSCRHQAREQIWNGGALQPLLSARKQLTPISFVLLGIDVNSLTFDSISRTWKWSSGNRGHLDIDRIHLATVEGTLRFPNSSSPWQETPQGQIMPLRKRYQWKRLLKRRDSFSRCLRNLLQSWDLLFGRFLVPGDEWNFLRCVPQMANFLATRANTERLEVHTSWDT